MNINFVDNGGDEDELLLFQTRTYSYAHLLSKIYGQKDFSLQVEVDKDMATAVEIEGSRLRICTPQKLSEVSNFSREDFYGLLFHHLTQMFLLTK